MDFFESDELIKGLKRLKSSEEFSSLCTSPLVINTIFGIAHSYLILFLQVWMHVSSLYKWTYLNENKPRTTNWNSFFNYDLKSHLTCNCCVIWLGKPGNTKSWQNYPPLKTKCFGRKERFQIVVIILRLSNLKMADL